VYAARRRTLRFLRRSHTLGVARALHKGTYLSEGQSGMMFDVCDFGGARQELVEVAAPAGRVEPVAISSRRGA